MLFFFSPHFNQLNVILAGISWSHIHPPFVKNQTYLFSLLHGFQKESLGPTVKKEPKKIQTLKSSKKSATNFLLLVMFPLLHNSVSH